MMETLIDFISEYEAERQYALNRLHDSIESGDTLETEMYEAIAGAFGDLVNKLKTLKT